MASTTINAPKKRGRQTKANDEGTHKAWRCKTNGCTEPFVRKEHLKRHYVSVHTDIKPFTCITEGCNKPFNRSDNVTQHLRSHNIAKGVLGTHYIKNDISIPELIDGIHYEYVPETAGESSRILKKQKTDPLPSTQDTASSPITPKLETASTFPIYQGKEESFSPVENKSLSFSPPALDEDYLGLGQQASSPQSNLFDFGTSEFSFSASPQNHDSFDLLPSLSLPTLGNNSLGFFPHTSHTSPIQTTQPDAHLLINTSSVDIDTALPSSVMGQAPSYNANLCISLSVIEGTGNRHPTSEIPREAFSTVDQSPMISGMTDAHERAGYSQTSFGKFF